MTRPLRSFECAPAGAVYTCSAGPVGERRWWRLGVSLALAALASACGGGDSSPTPPTTVDAPGDDFDRLALLKNLGENIVLPLYTQFSAETADLEAAVGAYCEGLGGADEDSLRTAAQAGWQAAMNTWQQAEVMQFGPVAMDDGAPRDVIYSWSIVSSCAVDQDVNLYRQDPAAYDISARLTNRRGLDALEYVLFQADLNHTCPSQTAPEGWDALDDAARATARCGYAEVAAADLAAQAAGLRDAWHPDSGNYVASFASAEGFASAQAALNVVTDAMFYLDTETKDMKLAEPAGIAENQCSAMGTPCEPELESPYAERSREHVIGNLTGIQRIYLGEGLDGTDGVGFDEFLRALGAADVADQMTAAIADAITAAEAVPGTMRGALASDYDTVVAAHAGVKAITDLIKSQFLTVLGLDLPESGGSDND